MRQVPKKSESGIGAAGKLKDLIKNKKSEQRKQQRQENRKGDRQQKGGSKGRKLQTTGDITIDPNSGDAYIIHQGYASIIRASDLSEDFFYDDPEVPAYTVYPKDRVAEWFGYQNDYNLVDGFPFNGGNVLITKTDTGGITMRINNFNGDTTTYGEVNFGIMFIIVKSVADDSFISEAPLQVQDFIDISAAIRKAIKTAEVESSLCTTQTLSDGTTACVFPNGDTGNLNMTDGSYVIKDVEGRVLEEGNIS